MSIFISIVVGGDSDAHVAMRAASERADSPDQLSFAVARAAGALLPRFDCSPVPARRVGVVDVPSALTGPCGRAGALVMSLYGGETWILQVAPGAEFQPHWDTVLIEKAAALNGAGGRSIISVPRVLRPGAGFDPAHLGLAFEDSSLQGEEPVRGFQLSGGCIFAPGQFVDQFPADPWLDGPEADQALALRLFTHGWDIYYTPGHPILPGPHPRPDGHSARRPAAANLRSRQRLTQLIGAEASLGAYGLGRHRSLQEYAHASGIDYRNRRIEALAYSPPSAQPEPALPSLSAGRALDDSWKSWLAENLQRGCRPDELLDILSKHEFSLASIREGMGVCFPQTPSLRRPADALRQAMPDFAAIARPALVRRLDPMLRRIETDKLQLYTLDEFLSDGECDALAALINQHLQPSTVTTESNDKYFRTSRTCHLSDLEDPLVAMVDQKMARTLGIRRAYAEPNQAQRYDIGQEFKAHTDYFEPGTDEFATFGGDRGNRTWTFMVYLNDGMQGGATRFFAIDKTFAPKKGQAVIWNNLYPDGSPNPDTLHSGMPVTQGHKIIITMWFRALGGSGPVLLED